MTNFVDIAILQEFWQLYYRKKVKLEKIPQFLKQFSVLIISSDSNI